MISILGRGGEHWGHRVLGMWESQEKNPLNHQQSSLEYTKTKPPQGSGRKKTLVNRWQRSVLERCLA